MDTLAREEGIRSVVVIPVLSEYDYLFDTLAALRASKDALCAETLVICVINNSAAPTVAAATLENNQKTLGLLRQRIGEEHYAPLRLAVVDACTEGRELPEGEGVGLARKIGLDHGLHLLSRSAHLDGALISLDADSPPAPGFLEAMDAHYRAEGAWAGYAAYLHSFPDDETQKEAVIAHELYMRYHELALQHCASPYAYPALGSIISCTAHAYAAMGGMNRRLAGEDFYFMQQLRKTGKMEPIACALVFPSGRLSRRTPFGTGQRIYDYKESTALELPLPHPQSFVVLKALLQLLSHETRLSGTAVIAAAQTIHPQLAAFMNLHGFKATWDKIRGQQPDLQRLHKQFHVWFDGLKTIQLLHHLRDNAYPDQPAATALPWLIETIGGEALPISDSKGTLDRLRQLCLLRHVPHDGQRPDYYPEAFLNFFSIS